MGAPNLKIFWSWQSDTQGKTGRFFVRDALEEAIKKLKQAPEIEEPTAQATREGLHLDQDVKNTPGSPDLARTILAKIDASQVVVADVTITGRTEGQGITAGKKLINSNVAIELGYAFRSRGDENVVLVVNAHYGAHEDLPFDLRHKGGAIVFDLPPDADKPRIEAERKKLISQFSAKLKPYLQTATTVAAPSFQEWPSTYLKAAYFAEGEILAQIGEPAELLQYFYDNKQLAYIRLIPAKALAAPIPLAALRQKASQMPLLRRGYDLLPGHNQHGAIAFEPDQSPRQGPARLTLKASTQLFQNGELWSIASHIIVTDRGDRPAWIKVPFVHSLTFEQLYYDTLVGLIAAAKLQLGLSPPWQIELGLIGVDGVYVVGMPDPDNSQWGPIRKPEIIQRMILNEDTQEAISTILIGFYSQLYDATGYPRPNRLHGFPPSRPTDRQ